MNRHSKEVLQCVLEQKERQNGQLLALLAAQQGRPVGIKDLMPALSQCLPAKKTAYLKHKSAKGSHTDEAKAIARKLLNAIGHLTDRMSTEEERSALQIQKEKQKNKLSEKTGPKTSIQHIDPKKVGRGQIDPEIP